MVITVSRCIIACDLGSSMAITARAWPVPNRARERISAAIGLIVFALNEAANSAGSSGVKRSIVNPVSAYLKLRESLNGTIDSAIEKRVLANTSNLKSECGS
jgi:hypothetical protein